MNNSENQLNVITGDDNQNFWLNNKIQKSLKTAKSIDIIVSFLMESGVLLLLDSLKEAISHNIPIRILTGNYLNITEPSALYLLKQELGEGVDLRFYNDNSRSFHPKSYIFEQEDYNEIYIGSSNISQSALTRGIEWNYRIDSRLDNESVNKFKETFEDLFNNHSIIVDNEVLKNYSKNWHRPKVYDELEKPEDNNVIPLYRPRGIQIEALASLKNSRNEGADKALVQAATGTGKTFLAAFDTIDFNRVLFIAHRNEILNQASLTFEKVSKEKSQGFFRGNQKDTKEDIIFASVSTLGQDKYLNSNYFNPEDFDYIVIDEFHHAVTNQYKKIIDYFKPKFLLGLTATPERLDRKNVFEICDYNVPYQIDLFEAINRGLLVPYHYYGIFDEIDYNQVAFKNGHYLTDSLNQVYLNNLKRSNLVLKHYLKHSPNKTIGFCSSKEHAEYMAEFFCKNNIPAVAVYSGKQSKYSMNRDEALKQLREGKIKVIFSVDMFNEGLDIPEIDCVLFLRPTESPTVFFQQLGRGLRKSKNKEYLTVLDFLGNYKKAFLVPSFLSPEFSGEKIQNIGNIQLPDDCFIDFDLTLIDLLDSMQEAQKTRKILVQDEYFRIKEELNHRPTRLELFTLMDSNIFEEVLKLPTKSNPFKNYLAFLDSINELESEEKEFFTSVAIDFIHLVETTNMTRVYKMPILASFIDKNQIIKEPSKEDLIKNWISFFSKRGNYKDLSYVTDLKSFKNVKPEEHLKKIKEMPINFLVKSGKGFFNKTQEGLISLSDQLDEYLDSPILLNQLKDIINYRTIYYYKRKYDQEYKK